jgi:adenylate cyclase
MGQHMRVNVQLIDARTDEHRWAERFDRQSSDLFSVQDELIDEIVVAIDSLVAAGEAARIRVAATEVPEARRLALMSAVHLGRSDEEGLRKSQECADKALSLEPTSVGAMLMAGISRIRRATSGWAPLEETIAEAVNLARQAEDTGIAPGSGMLMEGAASLALGDFDAAVEIGRRSVALAPNLANSHNNYARALNAVGAFDEARSEAIKGISQHPNIFPIFLMPLGISLLMTARFADANAVFERFRGLLPNATPDVMFLAASLAASGQLKAARRVCVEVTDYFPSLTISDIVRPHPFKHQEHKDRMWSYFSALKLDD